MEHLLPYYEKQLNLNDSEIAILYTKIRKFDIDKSLKHVQEETGEKISERTYWRIRGKLSAEVTSRLYWIAKNLTERHLDRMHELEMIRDEQWKQYEAESEPYKKSRILKEIKEIIPILAAFDEAAKNVYKDALGIMEKEQSVKVLQVVPIESQ